jgi:hypothetical protein
MTSPISPRSDAGSITPDDGGLRSARPDRDETPTEGLDRNWDEILQELRVTQTGTQILTGFLLTLAFQPRFTDLDPFQVTVYLCLVVLAALSTGLGLAPVSLHRGLFRKKAKAEMVKVADTLLQVILGAIALLLSGTTLLIFDVVTGRAAGLTAGLVTLVLTVALWVLLPFGARPRSGRANG